MNINFNEYLEKLKDNDFIKNDAVINILTSAYKDYMRKTHSKYYISNSDIRYHYAPEVLKEYSGRKDLLIESYRSSSKMLETYPKGSQKDDAVLITMAICKIINKQTPDISAYDMVMKMSKARPAYIIPAICLYFIKNTRGKGYWHIALGNSISTQAIAVQLKMAVEGIYPKPELVL